MKVLSKITLLIGLLYGVTASAIPFDMEFGERKFTESPLGNSRILVVCLPDHATIESKQADPLYRSTDWQGFEERDVVVVEMRKYSTHVIGQHARGSEVPRYNIHYAAGYKVGSGTRGVGLVSQCENKLEYVLIGKDGTQKQRWDLFPSNNDLYALIDAMPMRQYEMRQKASNK